MKHKDLIKYLNMTIGNIIKTKLQFCCLQSSIKFVWITLYKFFLEKL